MTLAGDLNLALGMYPHAWLSVMQLSHDHVGPSLGVEVGGIECVLVAPVPLLVLLVVVEVLAANPVLRADRPRLAAAYLAVQSPVH